ncbi:polysaccharide deacetylase family protein [Thermicanus aegyptius]|uniref:polysaccharide deacetylase family protein n=1 Tax=Thermicanus aegyptius TaxID=94009 RepID=UPI0005872760|nr:polysaccharide deacetylase family protein [Thermicanus aegyptius]
MKRRTLGFILVLVFVVGIFQWEPVGKYLEVFGNPTSAPEEDPFYQKIVQEAKGKEEAPIEPWIDPVWKLTPGYNGIRVNLDETYRVSRNKGGKVQWVTEEIKPRKTLWDFPPTPIYRGNPRKKMVAFMINVAWGNEYIEPILSTLREKQVKATFFFDGSWLKKNPELARTILADGHEVGNHAYTHPQMSRLSRERIIEEISGTNKEIEQVLGITSKYFAPPSGDYDSRVVSEAWKQKMLTVLWTLDTVDWRKPSTEEMVTRIVRKASPGNLILMHPTKPTAEGLKEMIEGIEAKGIRIGTVSQLLSSSRFPLENPDNF